MSASSSLVMLASSVNSRTGCRHLSRKWLLPSSRTLPHLLRMTGSVLLGGRCLASPTTTSTSFRPFRRCLAVCSLEDTASASGFPSHPCLFSRLSRMLSSVLNGGHCCTISSASFLSLLPDIWQCAHRRTLSSSTHTPHALPSLAVSSREDVVFTFISSLALGTTPLVAVMAAALGAGHYSMGRILIGEATAEPLR